MKILYIIESLTSGGKERRLVSVIKELIQKENIEIEMIILSNVVHYKEIYNLNIKIHFLKRNIKKDPLIIFKFNTILKNFSPNIVHCWDNIAAFHFAPICKWKRIPFINSMISTAPPTVPIFSKKYFFNVISYPFSDIILTNSKAGLKSYRVPKKKGRCIYNGFDFTRGKYKIPENLIRDNFNIHTDFIVGMTGGFYDRKDYSTFVKAGEMVLKNRKDVTFVAIGGGPNLEKIKGSVGADYFSNFRFVGEQDDVESIVNTFTIGVLATFTEGISNAIMEYMFFEKPVIATDGGGTNELVKDNKNGYLLEPQHAEQLAERILFLLDNPMIRKEMGKYGKEIILKKFSIDSMIDQTFQLYRECLNMGSGTISH